MSDSFKLYNIESEIIDKDGFIEVDKETTNEKLFEIVYAYAKKFADEQGNGKIPFIHKGTMIKPYKALLFTEKDRHLETMGEKRCNHIYGTCVFTKTSIINEHGERWVLKWVWLHPSFRKKGKFNKVWLKLEKKFGDFYIDEPISIDMRKFLNKVNSSHLEIDDY